MPHRGFSARQLLISCLLTLAVAGCAKPYQFFGTPYEPPAPAPVLAGANWDGSEFRLSNQADEVALIFFGYTFCPDVCPLTLSDMKRLMEQLGEQAGSVTVVFVSVDPERDTPERLAHYLTAFDRCFIGLSLTSEALEAAQAGFGVIAERHYYKPEDTAAGYLVDHTARIYLVDRAGRLRLSYAFATPVEEIVADIRYLLDEP